MDTNKLHIMIAFTIGVLITVVVMGLAQDGQIAKAYWSGYEEGKAHPELNISSIPTIYQNISTPVPKTSLKYLRDGYVNKGILIGVELNIEQFAEAFRNNTFFEHLQKYENSSSVFYGLVVDNSTVENVILFDSIVRNSTIKRSILIGGRYDNSNLSEIIPYMINTYDTNITIYPLTHDVYIVRQ